MTAVDRFVMENLSEEVIYELRPDGKKLVLWGSDRRAFQAELTSHAKALKLEKHLEC